MHIKFHTKKLDSYEVFEVSNETDEVYVEGIRVWTAPKPKVRVHPATVMLPNDRGRVTFWKEDGEFDLYIRDGYRDVYALPATYA